ncbi:Serine/threonine-protein kinase PknB [Rosistilla carotiformis]|uniref:Serine/threonine-protein kinase PknB n=1 Tax=Rosistilla carotiformis TaxID=2528017 RepID=A0A518JZG5_9BACT|nr:protein kinase [Rosistilla carotiformis]QDV70943.1 Serine/threonine-protein kinase PknB [Rosistilla carotiformis]
MNNIPEEPDGQARQVGTRPLTTSMSSEEAASEPGDDTPKLGTSRYEINELIERGGMGAIFSARDLQLSRNVAIKVLRADRSQNSQAKQGFINEARIMSYLSHPGVTPIYECGTCEDQRPFYAMKLIDGTTLADMITSRACSTSHLVYIFADVCQTVAFAHSRGVLHLDLKPGNVMVGKFGEVHVMDWGLARIQGGAAEKGIDPPDLENENFSSVKGTVNGTPGYMSPEQARGRKLDKRADVFSLGAILCEILIGHAPYEGKDAHQIHKRAMTGSMQAAIDLLEHSTQDCVLIRLAKQCLARHKKERPRSAVEVAQAMATYHESAFQQMESDMQRFFELSLDLFCIAKADGYFQRINSNFSRVLGHSDSDLLARPFLDFVHPEDVDETMRQMELLQQGQPVVGFRNRYRTVSGEFKTLEWVAKSIANDNIIFAVARSVP